MKCPNKSYPDWKALVEKVGVVDAYLHYFNNGQEIPDPDNIQETFKGVRAGMKLLDVMTTDKGVSLFNRFFKNNPGHIYQLAFLSFISFLLWLFAHISVHHF